MYVREIMSPKPETLRPGLPIRDLEAKLIVQRVGGFPVVDKGKLVGMVTRSDLVRVLEVEHMIDDQLGEGIGGPMPAGAESTRSRGARIGARLEAMTVADVMIRNVISVPADTSVVDAAQSMLDHRIHHLPVLDEGNLVGMLTSLDIARLVAERRFT